jgi:hypothetical protein
MAELISAALADLKSGKTDRAIIAEWAEWLRDLQTYVASIDDLSQTTLLRVVVWLLLLMLGTWLSSQIQSGSTGIGYVGTQAEIAFLLSMIQGQGPPLSPTPGLDRFAGIMAGLSLLLVITMVVSLFRLTQQPAPPARSN